MSSFRNSAPDLNRNPGYLGYLAGVKQKKRRSTTIYQCDFGGDCRTEVAKSTYFCNTHTCTALQDQAPCFNEVIQSGATRCVFHYQCTVNGCLGKRVVTPNDRWWDCCEHHKCDADECYSLKKFNVQTGRHFLYCPKRKLQPTPSTTSSLTLFYRQMHTCSKEVCNAMVEGDEKLCARRAAQATVCKKMENTRNSVHVTHHAQALHAQERRNLPQSSATCISATTTDVVFREHSTWKETTSCPPITVPSMSVKNLVVTSTPPAKHVATAAHIIATNQAAMASD
ncbi:hypothetical protein V501_06581 [Pseudogymnoascus sp. VKM F-4519 (FW-2642)]|nr:hypothetical protein V501_06581 [Pseudogymnoascus sp. VKM F-4519 (FW-2642)]